MPRFLFETPQLPESRLRALVVLTETRFPEIAFEHRFDAHTLEHHTVWVCRAPSEGHVWRWSISGGLAITGIRAVEHTDC